MSTNFIIATPSAEGSRVDHLSVEPIIIVPRLTLGPLIDYTTLLLRTNAED